MSTWDDRYATPAKPLGESLFRFPPESTKRQFQGFRLDPSGIPTFLYEENGEMIEDSIAPLPSGRLRRTIKRGGAIIHQSVQLENQQATFHDEK